MFNILRSTVRVFGSPRVTDKKEGFKYVLCKVHVLSRNGCMCRWKESVCKHHCAHTLTHSVSPLLRVKSEHESITTVSFIMSRHRCVRANSFPLTIFLPAHELFLARTSPFSCACNSCQLTYSARSHMLVAVTLLPADCSIVK